jgi:hypothetical protein
LIVAAILAIGFLLLFVGLAVVVLILAQLASLPQGRGTGRPRVAGKRDYRALREADLGIGGPLQFSPRTVKLQIQTAVKIEPQCLAFRFAMAKLTPPMIRLTSIVSYIGALR